MRASRNRTSTTAALAALVVAIGTTAVRADDAPVVEPVDLETARAANTGQSAAVTDLVFPVVMTWEEAIANRDARLAAGPAPMQPSVRSRSEFLPAGDYNLPENPLEIIAKRKRIAEAERAARAAIAAGRRPVSLFPPPDPRVDHMDMSFVDELFERALPPRDDAAVGAAAADPALQPMQHRFDSVFETELGDPGLDIRTSPGGNDEDDPSAAPTNHIDWQAITDSGRPSDATCAVGAAHVGVVVNRRLAFYTKDGTLVRGPVDFEDWWSSSPGGLDLYDPKIIYDNHNNRWVMMALEGRRIAQTYYAVSISQTSNPEGSWWTYYFRSDTVGGNDTAFWADFPGLGFDSGTAVDATGGGGVYITSNQYNASDDYQYCKLRVLYKHQIYNGAGAGGWEFWNYSNDDGSKVFTWKPAMTYSGVTSGGNPVEYMLNTRSGGADWITRWRITDPLGGGPTLGGPVEIAVNTYDVPPAAKQQGGGSSLLIDANDCRTQDVQYRGGHVYMACADLLDWGTPDNVEAVLHYFKIDTPVNTVVWDIRYGADNLYYTYPAIKVDVNQDATIVFSRMGASEFAGIRVTGRLENEGSTQGSALVKAGEATYNPTSNSVERWGDYNGLGVDCAGDRTGVWVTSQYADSSTAWHTWLAGTSFGQTNVLHLNDLDTSGFVSEDRYFTWEVRDNDWSGVILYTALGGNTNVAASRDCPFGTIYQNSTFGTDIRDFIVANGTEYGNEFHHARVQHVSGPMGYRLEARNDSRDINVGSLYSGGFTSIQLMDLHEANLTSGKTYAAQLIPDLGTADLDLFTFRGSRENGRRADNDGSSQSGGAGVTETHVFSAAESSKYGFAVTNENFSTGDYTFKIWLKPVVTAIGNASQTCSASYTGPTPTLVEGSTPVTWSLVSGPSGMTIDPGSGVVFWDDPTIGAHPITIRATNPAGFDNEGWTLTVNRARPIVEPIGNETRPCGSSYTGPTPSVADPTCMNPITWSLVGGPSGMIINANTGVVSWSTPVVGAHAIRIRAANTAGSDDESWTLTITRSRPIVNPIGNASRPCGVLYTGPTPSVTDPGCMNPITWSLVSGPGGMTINASTGVVSWVDPAIGTHPITIRATNSAGFDDESWSLTVARAAPLVRPIGNESHCFGTPYTGPTPSVTDPGCMNPITWSLVAGPAGMTINANTGVVSWPSPTTGTYPITIRATNTAGFDDESWNLNVGATPGDVNCDGMVNFEDILDILGEWGPYTPCPPFKPEDIDQDCRVGFSDILAVLSNWSAAPPLVTASPTSLGLDPDQGVTPDEEVGAEEPESVPDVILINNGVLAPVAYGGVIDVAAHYMQTDWAALSIEIAGPGAVDARDLLLVRGHAWIGGALQVRFADGYRPESGDRFVVLTADSTEGTFAYLDLPDLAGGAEWRLDYGPATVSLVVVGARDAAASNDFGAPRFGDGDFDGNGRVTARDVALMLSVLFADDHAILPEAYAPASRMGPVEETPAMDLDGDGAVGLSDLDVLLTLLD